MPSQNAMNTILHLQSMEYKAKASLESNISIGCKEESTLSWFSCVFTHN